jgi:spore maturation protein CgeB
MKILLSGYHNPHYETVTEYMERAVESLGHEIVPFHDRCHLVPGRLREHLGTLRRLDLEWINRRLETLALDIGAQVVLVTGGNRILGKTVRRLRDRGVITVLWTTDPPIDFEPVLRAAHSYDHVFCQGTEAVEIFHGNGVAKARWLPVGCDPERHGPVVLTESERKEYGSDVVFVGSHYEERERLFEPLCGFDLALWGPGWENLPPRSLLRQHVRGAHCTPQMWLKIYSASRIILASHYHDPMERFCVHQASPRVFEAIACGGFLLCDRQRDVLELFTDGEHFVSFGDARDLAEKIRTFLGRPGEREAIARKGRAEALRRHTYVHRLGEMFSIVNGSGHERA